MSIWTILETICLIGCAVCLAVAAVLAVVAEVKARRFRREIEAKFLERKVGGNDE